MMGAMNTASPFDHPAQHAATRLTVATAAGVLTLLLGLIATPWMAKMGWSDPARAVADTVSLARDASVALVCLSLCAAYGVLAVRLGRRRMMLALLSALTAAVVYLGYALMRVSYARVPQIWDVATAPDLYMTARLQALRPDAPVAMPDDHQQLQAAYPDLKPQRIKADATVVYTRLLHLARQDHMRVVSDYRPLGQLEVTQRSDWFGLPLDLVMRKAEPVRPLRDLQLVRPSA